MSSAPIRTDEDHEAALREIERFWGADQGTRDGAQLNALVALVEAYENERWENIWRIPNAETRQAMAEATAILRARRNRP